MADPRRCYDTRQVEAPDGSLAYGSVVETLRATRAYFSPAAVEARRLRRLARLQEGQAMVSDALRPKSDDLAIGGSLFSMAWPLLWPALLFFAAFHLFAVDIPPAWLQALGQVEIGNRDAAIGAAGEVSRYQILPATWQAMAAPGDRPTDARAAGRVARRFWGEHCDRLAVRRAVTPRDAYALWHRPGLYRRVGYRFDALPAVVQRRCMRFARLTEVGR